MSTLLTLARRNMALTVLVVAALGLLMLNPFFYFGWQSAGDRQAELETDEMMASIQLSTAEAKYDLASLQAELQDVLRDIEEMSEASGFAAGVSTSSLDVSLASTASSYGVTVAGLSSDGKVTTEQIGSNTYDRFEMDIIVTGSLNNISSFVRSMETGNYANIKFEDLSLTRADDGQSWQGEMTLVILSVPSA